MVVAHLIGRFSMSPGEIVYFAKSGKANTDTVLDAVDACLRRTGIEYVVVASNSGETGLKTIARLERSGAEVVVVTSHAGFSGEGVLDMDPEAEESLVRAGAKVVRASHALSGVERSLSKKLGGSSRVEAVSEALRSLFGQGMKVCVEITVMASDSGAVPCGDVEIIAIGGTGEGADTACVVRPAHANSFFKMEIREILAIPRTRN